MKTSVPYTISKNIEVYGMRPLPRTKKILYRAVKFEVVRRIELLDMKVSTS